MVTFCRAPVAEVVAELVSPEVPAGPGPRHCRPGAGGRPLAEYNSGSGGKIIFFCNTNIGIHV